MITKVKINDVVPELASVWLAHFRMAVHEGLGTRPSGEWNSDPHCGAAAVLATRDVTSTWPRCYGGTVRQARETYRWSATRRACLATFEHAIRLGLEAPKAARAMRLARQLGHRRLGIHPHDTIKIEEWLELPLSERSSRHKKFIQDARRALLEHHVKMSNYSSAGKSTWIAIGNGYNAVWAHKPLTKDELKLREKNRKAILIELADLTN